MIWFLLGAAVSLGALNWIGAGGSRRYWLTAFAALGAFGVALTLQFPGGAGDCPPDSGAGCRAGFLLFLSLFVGSTALIGMGSLYGRLSVASFVALILSDLALVMAIWAHHGETSVWALPAVGGWGAASYWGAAAALLRLGAPMLASAQAPARAERLAGDRRGRLQRVFAGGTPQAGAAGLSETGLSCLGWWQGAFLAWWVGRPGGIVLVVGGLALWSASAALARPAPGALGAAGGLVAVGSALLVPPAGLAGTGLAGMALALGEPLIGIWALAALPASLLTTAALPSPIPASALLRTQLQGTALQVFSSAWLAAIPPAWSIVASRLKPPPAAPRPPGAWPVPRPAALLASLTAVAATVVGFARLDLVVWLIGGLVAAALVTRLLFVERGAAAPALPERQLQSPPGSSAVVGPNNETIGSVEASAADAEPAKLENNDEVSPKAPGAGRKDGSGPGGGSRRAKVLARAAPAWALLLLTVSLLGWLVWMGLQTEFL